MGVCDCSMFCCTLLYVHSSIAIILMVKRQLVALLNFSSWCLVMVELLFRAVPRGCLRFVIVAFPDHTHLLFLRYIINGKEYKLSQYADDTQFILDGTVTETIFEESKVAKIRNRYNQVPHLTQDTNGKVSNSQLDTTNERQEVSPFPAGDHKAHINRRSQMHSKHKTEKKTIKDPQKKYRLRTVSKIFYWRA